MSHDCMAAKVSASSSGCPPKGSVVQFWAHADSVPLMSTPWRRTVAPAALTNRLPSTWSAAAPVAVGAPGPDPPGGGAGEDGAAAEGRGVAAGTRVGAGEGVTSGAVEGGAGTDTGTADPVAACAPEEVDVRVAVPRAAGLPPALMAAVTPAIDRVRSRRARSLVIVSRAFGRVYGGCTTRRHPASRSSPGPLRPAPGRVS